VTPWTARTGAGFWQELWTCGEVSPHWSRSAGRTCDTCGGPTLEQSVSEGQRPVERTHAGAVHEELQPVRRTVSRGRDRRLKQRKSMRWMEWQRQYVMN